MPTNSRYLGFKRWQIIAAIQQIERELLGPPRVKPGSAADVKLRAERSELFAELQNRDEILIEEWKKGPKSGGTTIAQP